MESSGSILNVSRFLIKRYRKVENNRQINSLPYQQAAIIKQQPSIHTQFSLSKAIKLSNATFDFLVYNVANFDIYFHFTAKFICIRVFQCHSVCPNIFLFEELDILKGTHTHAHHVYIRYTFQPAGMVNIKLIYDFCGWNIKMLLPLERYNVCKV